MSPKKCHIFYPQFYPTVHRMDRALVNCVHTKTSCAYWWIGWPNSVFRLILGHFLTIFQSGAYGRWCDTLKNLQKMAPNWDQMEKWTSYMLYLHSAHFWVRYPKVYFSIFPNSILPILGHFLKIFQSFTAPSACLTLKIRQKWPKIGGKWRNELAVNPFLS